MRKDIILVGVLAAIAVTACTKDSVVIENTGTKEIGFNVLTNNSTRGVPVTTTNIIDQSKAFKVYGFNNSDNTVFSDIQGTIVSYSTTETKWDYSPKKYWPEYALDFYSVYPSDVTTIKIDATDKKINDFKPASDVTSQVDLLYGLQTNQTESPVKVYFKHALSQIVFQGKSVYEGPDVKINSVKLCRVLDKGSFTFPAVATASNSTAGTWDVTGASRTDYTIPLNAATPITLTPPANSSDVVYPTMFSHATNGALLIVPQDVTAWTTTPTTAVALSASGEEAHVYLDIECSLTNPDNAGEYVLGDASTYDHAYVPISAPDNKWEPGKKYTYTLTFGYGYDQDGKPLKKQPITFTVEAVEEWTSATEDITLP